MLIELHAALKVIPKDVAIYAYMYASVKISISRFIMSIESYVVPK